MVQITRVESTNPLPALALGSRVANEGERLDLANQEFQRRQANDAQQALTAEEDMQLKVALGTLSANTFEEFVQARALPSVQTALGEENAAALNAITRETFVPAREAIANRQRGSSALVSDDQGAGIATSVFDPATGTTTIDLARFGEGVTPVSKLGETGSEQSERLIEQTRSQAEAKGEVGRLGDSITEGLIAADGIATLNRALSLLDSVETGGVLNQAQLNAARALGVEDPDAGELSNLLGKAVLSQLRSTFGAAFTAEEGRSLRDIEASFGTNPAVNRRLINNALSKAQVAARRGLRAANETGDTFAADEIRRAMEATLGGGQGGGFEIIQVTP